MNKKKYTIVQILPALNTGGVERGVVEISKALIIMISDLLLYLLEDIWCLN